MENGSKAYKVVRALPDGHAISVGTYGNEREARKIIESLSEYWPGDYRILPLPPPEYETAKGLGGSFSAQ